jgi:hypothetical protein
MAQSLFRSGFILATIHGGHRTTLHVKCKLLRWHTGEAARRMDRLARIFHDYLLAGAKYPSQAMYRPKFL